MWTLRGLLCATIAAGVFVLPACGDDGGDDDAGTDTDTDTDTDTGSDTDSDSDTDTDTDSDAGADAGTDPLLPMTDCSGGKLDPVANLCWQNPPATETFNWDDAVAYCDGLDFGEHTDWRLPKIDELIGLLRGCQNGTATGDLSPSLCEMTPTGCAEIDNCAGPINCDACDPGSGPASGLYWDPVLSGGSDSWAWYWASCSATDSATDKFCVTFSTGDVGLSAEIIPHYVRCVREGP